MVNYSCSMAVSSISTCIKWKILWSQLIWTDRPWAQLGSFNMAFRACSPLEIIELQKILAHSLHPCQGEVHQWHRTIKIHFAQGLSLG